MDLVASEIWPRSGSGYELVGPDQVRARRARSTLGLPLFGLSHLTPHDFSVLEVDAEHPAFPGRRRHHRGGAREESEGGGNRLAGQGGNSGETQRKGLDPEGSLGWHELIGRSFRVGELTVWLRERGSFGCRMFSRFGLCVL